MENFSGDEEQKFGERVAEKIAGAGQVAGQKIDAAIDYVEDKKERAKQTLDEVCQDGWQGMKAKVMKYTRNEPFNALLIAVGSGLL